MSEFWGAIREYRPRRKKKGMDIGREEWEGHFKKLLGGEEEGEEERVEEEEGEGDEREGDEILDRDINLEEVVRALGGMKKKGDGGGRDTGGVSKISAESLVSRASGDT